MTAPRNSHSEKRPLSLWHVLKSVLAGAFGVQSDKNYHQDFKQSSPVPYIVVGIVFVVVFVLSLAFLVSLL
ncbi:DUF2970 domain-containing protein [Alteromonas sediminis]|uniref:DUF2970 domain-containing protein n=1 Tax=Alteromonas sediminis TaxID=2259342 RepID=A0A3N5YBI9_9ALTE|nr:DUF2970 domain-containing protein [Alteromonas sediminis]RPJ66375.1 DUF2970 domain-containing protein [Alteromonas sediminis]